MNDRLYLDSLVREAEAWLADRNMLDEPEGLVLKLTTALKSILERQLVQSTRTHDA